MNGNKLNTLSEGDDLSENDSNTRTADLSENESNTESVDLSENETDVIIINYIFTHGFSHEGGNGLRCIISEKCKSPRLIMLRKSDIQNMNLLKDFENINFEYLQVIECPQNKTSIGEITFIKNEFKIYKSHSQLIDQLKKIVLYCVITLQSKDNNIICLFLKYLNLPEQIGSVCGKYYIFNNSSINIFTIKVMISLYNIYLKFNNILKNNLLKDLIIILWYEFINTLSHWKRFNVYDVSLLTLLGNTLKQEDIYTLFELLLKYITEHNCQNDFMILNNISKDHFEMIKNEIINHNIHQKKLINIFENLFKNKIE